MRMRKNPRPSQNHEAKKDEDEDEEKSRPKGWAFIQKMVDAEVKRTVRIVEKASQFYKSYAFTDATNETIMMDAVAYT